MGRRIKQLVRKRAKVHMARVKKAHAKRVRARSRGQSPITKKRKVAAKRRMGRKARAR